MKIRHLFPAGKTFSRFLGIYILITVFCLLVLGFMASRNLLVQRREADRRTALDFLQLLEDQLNDHYYFAGSVQMELLSNLSLQQDILYYLSNDFPDYWAFHLDNYNLSSGNITPRVDAWLSQIILRSEDLKKAVLYSYDQHTLLKAERNDIKYLEVGMTGFREIHSSIQPYLDDGSINIQPFLYKEKDRELMLVLSVPVKNSDTLIKEGEILLFFSRPDIPVESSFRDLGAEIYLAVNSEAHLCYPDDMMKKVDLPDRQSAVKSISLFNSRMSLFLFQSFNASSIMPTIGLIILVTLFLITTSITAAYLFLRRFFIRINTITGAMEHVRQGDLSVRIPIKGDEDELALIGSVFNQMCIDLEEYITRSYIAKFNQKSAELTSLQNQIQPHFLYNTLEAIRMKAVSGGNEEIGKMIYHLAALFRHQLNNAMFISLGKELEFCISYLKLYRARYKEGFVIYNRIPPEFLSLKVLKLSLQPLVENYMKHGFDLERKDNFISLDCERKEGSVSIRLEDNGQGISPERLESIKRALQSGDDRFEESIGLINVHQRLRRAFGRHAGIDIGIRDGGGTVVTLTLPEQENENVQIIDN